MPNNNKKKKIKYKKFAFKLSEKQKSIIDRFCRAKKISHNKMIKSAIKDYIRKFADSLPEEEYIGENQLKLFDVDEETEIFDAADEKEEYKTTLF
jgi:ribosomal protein S20